ncbi:SpoIIE family protein phosphatase [Parasediminibacterium sp. JCM 36343]|uniref:SpoIIE family protein phosphatase n=1 Tax=Parasediminibacterium sp. JCM 36343 TaxID=3374279 RepID=UPI00397ADF28
MVRRFHSYFKADDRSYFAILKKEIHALAVTGNFSTRKVGEIDIIVSELASNLVKHGGGGNILVKLIEENNIQGIEIIGIDNGHGIANLSLVLEDGISTKNTLGHGMGAMKRLSDVFQVYSQKDWGTITLIRVFNEEPALYIKPPKIDIRNLILSLHNDNACGDGFYYTLSNTHLKLFLGDGLGHGPEAELAIEKAGEIFLKSTEIEPVPIIRDIHLNVKKTRGLVGTIAVFDITERKWAICGVGNISIKIINSQSSKNYLSYNGIIGLNLPNALNTQEVAYEKGQTIIMCSDGIKSRWDLSKHPAISRYDLSVLTACLVKDFARNTDDTAVMACKINL